MKTAIKILGLVGAVAGVVALKRKSDNKKVTVKGVKEDIIDTAVATKESIVENYDNFLIDAEKFVKQSVRKIKTFSKNVAGKAKDLDEKAKDKFDAKIAKITVAKDEIRSKVMEFQNAAENKKEALKKRIEIKKMALTKSMDAFEKEWK